MNAMKYLITAILIGNMTYTGQQARAEGPGSTGGGDPVSQEVRAIVRNIPSIIRSKGLHYFPEVDMVKLDDLTQKKISISLEENIIFEGAPKTAQFFRDSMSIKVDPVKWNALLIEPNYEMRKRAIITHEVFA